MKLKLLNGAPLCEHLDFSNSVLLEAAKCHAFDVTIRDGISSEENAALKWRDIGSKRAFLRSDWTQPFLPGSGVQSAYEGPSFMFLGVEESSALHEHDTTNPETTFRLEQEGEVSAAEDYLQQSLIFHDTLLSSQVVQNAVGGDETVASSSFLTTSFGTTDSEFSSPSSSESHALNLQVSSAMIVTPLGSLPNAHHLRSIYPQTPTPNLLCTLMTTPECREVFVRKGGYKMKLWEITVGDDTCSSFKVTFWSRPPRDSNNEQNYAHLQLLQILEHLQAGDIVLLRNIALTSFREMVYGQSLKTGMTRARTSVDVLVKSGGTSVAHIGGLPGSVVETFMRVKRWARSHVVGDANNVRKRKGELARLDRAAKRSFTSSARDENLPPDTMEPS
ncbi:hypothetical protein SVAN01_05010 [Stagonosporopsis vannaccii]|nr:hypothetical protein SVAN01_05010 [Stagonosporopsis vannaccii]